MAADREMAFRQENYFHTAARRVRGGQLRAGTGDKCSHIRGGSSGIGNIKYGRGLVTADTMSNKTEYVSVSVLVCVLKILQPSILMIENRV